MTALLLRAMLLARCRTKLAESPRTEDRGRLDRSLDTTMAFQPDFRHGQRLRKRYGKAGRSGRRPDPPPDLPPDDTENSSSPRIRRRETRKPCS